MLSFPWLFFQHRKGPQAMAAIGTSGKVEAFTRSFELAYFIHPEKGLAMRVATEAMNKLELAAAAQDKRLYYSPKGRSLPDRPKTDKFRTKVSVSELHLLQRLVYIESERHEREQEKASDGASVREEDMIIRYLKHLVRITLKRNSFYVTLGLSRLLHNYATADTAEIYNVVVQDPERVKDDYYYRKVKRQLMRELSDRFGSLIKIARVQRGEERFQPQGDSSRWLPLVKKCLNLFTPWNTSCPLPASFSVYNTDVPALAFKGGDPDQEHPVEIKRIHSVLHPDCYGRIIIGLRYDSPEKRMELPQFFLTEVEDDAGSPPVDRRSAPKLSQEEMMAVQSSLAEQAARRRSVVAGLLSINVDGTERARLDLDRAGHARFEIEEGAELIEVHARDADGHLLLATYLLTQNEISAGKQANPSAVVLEGGQKISFSVLPLSDPNRQAEGAVVEVTYRETNPIRAASLVLRRMKRRLQELLITAEWTHSPVLRPALALLLVAALGITLSLFIQSRQGTDRQQVAREEKPQSATGEEKSQMPPSSPLIAPPDRTMGRTTPSRSSEAPHTASPRATIQPRPDVAVKRVAPEALVPAPPSSQADISESEATRRPSTKLSGATLLQVERIYVEPLGSDPLSRSAHDQLIDSLQSTKRFTIVGTRDEADAVFRANVKRGAREAQITVRLVNAGGSLLWSTTQREVDGEASQIARALANSVVGNLLVELDRLRGKQ